MYGWEKLASTCGLGCKVFWHPWASGEKSPYDAVMKDDDMKDDTESFDPVLTEPMKPDWGDLTVRAPIVRNKSNSVTNIAKSGASYEKLPATENTPKLNNKRLSKPELSGSRGSLTGSRTSLAGSTTSSEVMEVKEMVTTV